MSLANTSSSAASTLSASGTEALQTPEEDSERISLESILSSIASTPSGSASQTPAELSTITISQTPVSEGLCVGGTVQLPVIAPASSLVVLCILSWMTA